MVITTMSTDERNFRSIYYEKVGFKNVEEKKSLELLLKEKILDQAKLKQFCLRFTVPDAYRNLLWKLLLDVLPMQVECHDFVMSQRKQEYNNLHNTLMVIRICDEKTPKPQVFLAMWLIQTGNLSLSLNLFQDKQNFTYMAIVKCLMHFLDDDTDIYWIARKFFDHICKMKNDIPRMLEIMHSRMEREDSELYKYIKSNSFFEHLPLSEWFECCFAGIFNQNCIVKIWDRICGGSYKILIYLAVVLFATLKHKILKITDATGITECVKNIPEETAEIIVNKTIDMWQHHGSYLTVHDKPKKLPA